MRLVGAGVGVGRVDLQPAITLGEGMHEAPAEVREVRRPLELLQRPLGPVYALIQVGPVAHVEIGVRASLAVAAGAGRQARAAEEEAGGVQLAPLGLVAQRDRLGV